MAEEKDLMSNTQVVVLMGGLGTRLGIGDRPKAMADVNGFPFFDYQLRLLRRWGFRKFLFLVSYMGDCIETYYKDGSKWQIDIRYSYDGNGRQGTGGALCHAADLLEDDFLLLYGDSFMDIDYQEVVYRYQVVHRDGVMGVMTLLCNYNYLDRSNVVYINGQLVLYDKKETRQEMHYIDYGVSMLSKEILEIAPQKEMFDLAEILTPLSKQGKLAGQIVNKRFYEIGTPISYKEFCEYAKRRFGQARKAIFLDRDGIINELIYNDDTEQLDSPFKKDEFIYKENAVELLKKIQEKGYYIFIVTNQPAAAKGKVNLLQLYDLNTWLVGDLRQKGIDIEFLNVCPHHSVGNDKVRDIFLITECECRKPKSGLITSLLDVYNIDKRKSYMIGDSYTDIIAGHEAGLKTILVGMLKCDSCQRLAGCPPDEVVSNLNDVMERIEKNG